MKSIISMMAALMLVLVCAGCGQSGPLYVPGDPSSINMPPETEASDEENENGEEDDSQ